MVINGYPLINLFLLLCFFILMGFDKKLMGRNDVIVFYVNKIFAIATVLISIFFTKTTIVPYVFSLILVFYLLFLFKRHG